MAQIVILGREDGFHHAEALVERYGSRVKVTGDYGVEAVMRHEPEMVIAYDTTDAGRALCLAECGRQGIATLQVMDGIVEWRNTWCRRSGSDRFPLNQAPVVHKVACLGALDARVYGSWGNHGMCEVVGCPRLDGLREVRRSVRTQGITGRRMRLLVMTAKTPGFNEDEIATTIRSLIDLRQHLSEDPDIETIWRLSKGIHNQVGVDNRMTCTKGVELAEILKMVDAVVTTPSTAQLEAMLMGLPTALLSYHAVPVYTPAAWTISSGEHIRPVLEGLRNPPLERSLYQDACLEDALYLEAPATDRLVQLIEAMLVHRRQSLGAGERTLRFPDRMLPAFSSDAPARRNPQDGVLERLYPEHEALREHDVGRLQAELDAALIVNRRLKLENDLLRRRLLGIPGYEFVRRIWQRIRTVH